MLQYLYTKIKQLKTENTTLHVESKGKIPESFSFFSFQTYLQKSTPTHFTKPFKEIQFSGQDSFSIEVFLEQLKTQMQMQELKDDAQQFLLFFAGLTT
jgi:hypothetical protein